MISYLCSIETYGTMLLHFRDTLVARNCESVASEWNQHCGGKASSQPKGLSRGNWVLGRVGNPYHQLGAWGTLKAPQLGLGWSLELWCMLGQVSSAAVLLCKDACNQLINLAYYCWPKKSFHPMILSIVGATAPIAPRFRCLWWWATDKL